MSNQFFDFDLLAFPKETNTSFTIKGKGGAAVLILTHFQDKNKEEDLAFMVNVLKAANLTPIEDQIFHLQAQNEHISLSLASIIRTLNIESILIFGLEPKKLGLQANLVPYQFTPLNDKYIMWGHSIATIREERAAKKNEKAAALWLALKGQFLG